MPFKPKIYAALLVLILVVTSFATVIFFTESPLLLFFKIKKSNSCAVIAIRDDVIPFQKFGTRLFTYPYLTATYSEVIYLTEYRKDEKRKDFVAGLNKLLSDHKQVDIYLLAHANMYYKWVEEIDSAQRQKIRLVYNTGCSGAEQEKLWLGLGAKTYVAHRSSESISPVFYFYFLRRCCAGKYIDEATAAANNCMKEKLNGLNVKIDSAVLFGSQASCFGKGDYNLHDEQKQ